ncbi:hypothetical protein [Xanthomonas nasturtii]|uniref:Uncharacterized protein n=1 Tax=Xanthomonas nasturtii TaxID=1843581 RepID=A0ABT0LWM3_9XANT|nr:hypothetical protein [Xanthomonas nasturtii]MCL1553744.1 hypothetical protein [Xanthomonas nasturtii]MCL1557719.1 hypothetical protein [Xanthomonas nasturtii]
MADLVHKATGFPTSVKQLRSNESRAKVLLVSYARRSYDCIDPNEPILSLFDVIAALSSFRYQQEAGDDYKPYWHGQTDQGKSPQRLFDKGLNSEDPHQHQGVMHIYLNRFYEYQAAFNGAAESNQAWMHYQMTVHRLYKDALQLNDIMAITMGLTVLNFHCVNLVKDYAIEYLAGNR